jgi:hypothetical protein
MLSPKIESFDPSSDSTQIPLRPREIEKPRRASSPGFPPRAWSATPQTIPAHATHFQKSLLASGKSPRDIALSCVAPAARALCMRLERAGERQPASLSPLSGPPGQARRLAQPRATRLQTARTRAGDVSTVAVLLDEQAIVEVAQAGSQRVSRRGGAPAGIRPGRLFSFPMYAFTKDRFS